MTSSLALHKRHQMKDVWSISNFGDPNNSLGGWEDHYIINGAHRECHPNYEAIPIGNPYGFMVCKKIKNKEGKGLDEAPWGNGKPPPHASDFNGYHKYSADLYRPWRQTQIQTSDPYDYYDRTMPDEEYYHRNDYVARGIRYDGTGVKVLRTPGDRTYYEYGFSYTKEPPLKYDITRLHQAYPVWKEEQSYIGANQTSLDELDKRYHSYNTMGVM